MALTQEQITAQNFKDFYGQIRPYLNGSAHAGFTPVGTVISVMGKQAPLNYLVCDGMVYNIKDYPELAAYFAGQFDGASNFFGGDGETTFAVPDLRGEFLRGAGTNSHSGQGSGSTVGIHQDGTENPMFGYFHQEGKTNPYMYLGDVINKDQAPESNLNIIARKVDKTLSPNGTSITAKINADSTYTANNSGRYIARPTNTSVLYCIATHNMFMNEGSNYSTDEQIVGTWIDGKPIYQKVFILSPQKIININVWVDIVSVEDLNIELVIDQKFIEKEDFKYNISTNTRINNGMLQTFFNDHGEGYHWFCDYVIIQYTKTTD